MSTKTREEWLIAATEAMRPLFAEVGAEIPAVRISVGWPGGGGRNLNKVIGQCWATRASADGVAQIFISPVLDHSETVLATLAHELVHAVDDCKSGHKGDFVRIAKGIGLTGKMTATVAGDELLSRLSSIVAEIGPYPHAKLETSRVPIKKQSTRMLKVYCETTGYTLRTTRKWLEEYGEPICPCCRQTMVQG